MSETAYIMTILANNSLNSLNIMYRTNETFQFDGYKLVIVAVASRYSPIHFSNNYQDPLNLKV